MKDGVSVIIPTYNLASLLPRAVRSALAAAAPGDEVLVIDDGSTDGTPAVVRPFGDAIRYVRVEPNAGRGAARNLGIRLAQHPLVAFLDHDDEWSPDKLELQRAVMEKFPEAVFCFTNLITKFSNGKIIPDVLSNWRQSSRVGWSNSPGHLSAFLGPGTPFSSIAALPEGRADFNVHVGDMYPALMEVLYATTSAIMVRKDLAGDSFLFDGDLPLMEIWDLSSRLAKKGPAAYLDCELAVQGVHSGPRGTDAPEMTHSSVRIELLQRIWGADVPFLAKHSLRYRSLLKDLLVRRARLRISEGQLTEARKDLAVLGGPLSYRALAYLPSVVVKHLLGFKRRLSRRKSRRQS